MRAFVYNGFLAVIVAALFAVSFDFDVGRDPSGSANVGQWILISIVFLVTAVIRALSAPLEHYLVTRDRKRWTMIANVVAIIVVMTLTASEMIVRGVAYVILDRTAPSVSSRAVFGAFDTGQHDFTTFALRFTLGVVLGQLLWVLLALIPLALLAIGSPGPLRRHDRVMRVLATSYLIQDKRYQFANRQEIRAGRAGRHLEVSDQRIRPYLPSWHIESSPPPRQMRGRLFRAEYGQVSANTAATVMSLFISAVGFVQVFGKVDGSIESWVRPAIGIGVGIAAVSIFLLLARREGVEARKLRHIQV